MTRDDRSSDPREVPSWVDEVLSAPGSASARPQTSGAPAPDPAPSPTPPEVTVASVDPAALAPPAPASPASGPGDLRIPEPGGARPTPTPLTPPDLTAAPRPSSQTAPTLLDSADDWIARATGGTARSPGMPGSSGSRSSGSSASAPSLSPFQTESATPAPLSTRPPDPWAAGSAAPLSGDVATRRLIAGLLGIVLGAFGVHKLYLGITTPGLIMLGVNVGVWIVALLLGLLTLGFGLVITLPLAGLVSGALGLLGLVEGILYLTKSDADFYQQYMVEKKPWL